MSAVDHLKEAKRRLAQAAATRRGDDPSPLHNPYTQASLIGQAQGQALVALVEAVQGLAAALAPPTVPMAEGITLDQARAMVGTYPIDTSVPDSWASWRDVPNGLAYRGSATHIKTIYINREGVRHAIVNGEEHPSTVSEPTMRRIAPFVLAEASEQP